MKNSSDFEVNNGMEHSKQLANDLSELLNKYSLEGVTISEFTVAKTSSNTETSPLCHDMTKVLRTHGITTGEVCSVTLTTPAHLEKISDVERLLGLCWCCGDPDPVRDAVRCKLQRCPC